jgi:hypothetical protein
LITLSSKVRAQSFLQPFSLWQRKPMSGGVGVAMDQIRPSIERCVGRQCTIVVARDRSKEAVNAAAAVKPGAGLAMQMQLGRPRSPQTALC